MPQQGPSILIRCDGSPALGMGHVVRCLALADELRDRHRASVTFVMRGELSGTQQVCHAGYKVCRLPEAIAGASYGSWLQNIVQRHSAQALVLDVRDDLPRSAIEDLRGEGMRIATIDDPSERRLAADLAFYPPVPQLRRVAWDGFRGKLHIGWEWVILRRQFAQRPQRVHNDRPVLLVTMGGSDPAGLTLRAVEALNRVTGDFRVWLVLGSAFQHREGLRDLLTRSPRPYECLEDVRDMAALMAQADLAIASFGVTAYELAAMGVPAIYYCLTSDHAESAQAFVEYGMAKSLGVYSEVNPHEARKTMETLLKDQVLRQKMALCGVQRVDGRGAARVADSLVATD